MADAPAVLSQLSAFFSGPPGDLVDLPPERSGQQRVVLRPVDEKDIQLHGLARRHNRRQLKRVVGSRFRQTQQLAAIEQTYDDQNGSCAQKFSLSFR